MFHSLTLAILTALSLEAALLAYPRLAALPDVSSWTQSVYFQYSIAHIPYLVAIYWLSRSSSPAPRPLLLWLAAFALRLLVLPLAPLLSDDLARYAWEAQTWSSGANPYLSTPRLSGADPLLVPGPDARAVYGPVLQILHFLAWSAGSLKLSAALADSLLLVVLWRYCRLQSIPLWRWAIYAWSPLSIVEFWRQGHNDAWLLLLLFSALALAQAGRAFPAWLAWTAAIFTKWWPALWLPFFLRRSWSAPGLATLLAAAGLAWYSLGSAAWTDRLQFTTGFLGGWQNNAFLYRLLSSKWQAVAVLSLAALPLAFSPAHPMRLSLACITWLLAWSANIHPWYLSWFLPFVAVAASRPLPWLLAAALAPLLYAPMPAWRLLGRWQEDHFLALAIWSTLTIYSFVTYWRSRTR